LIAAMIFRCAGQHAHPHVHHHRDAEGHARVNPQRAAAELGDEVAERHVAGEQETRLTCEGRHRHRAAADLLRHDVVEEVDEEREEEEHARIAIPVAVRTEDSRGSCGS
jgi:hypothetical protein